MATKTLKFVMVDHGWYEAEGTTYCISNNNSLYTKPKDREASFSVVTSKNPDKKLFTAKTKKECLGWVTKKTGKTAS